MSGVISSVKRLLGLGQTSNPLSRKRPLDRDDDDVIEVSSRKKQKLEVPHVENDSPWSPKKIVDIFTSPLKSLASMGSTMTTYIKIRGSQTELTFQQTPEVVDLTENAAPKQKNRDKNALNVEIKAGRFVKVVIPKHQPTLQGGLPIAPDVMKHSSSAAPGGHVSGKPAGSYGPIGAPVGGGGYGTPAPGQQSTSPKQIIARGFKEKVEAEAGLLSEYKIKTENFAETVIKEEKDESHIEECENENNQETEETGCSFHKEYLKQTKNVIKEIEYGLVRNKEGKLIPTPMFYDNGGGGSHIWNKAAEDLGLEPSKRQYKTIIRGTLAKETEEWGYYYKVPLVGVPVTPGGPNLETEIYAFGVEKMNSHPDVDFTKIKEAGMFQDDPEFEWATRNRPSGQMHLMLGNSLCHLHPVDCKVSGKLKIKKSKFGEGYVMTGSHEDLVVKDVLTR